MYMYMYIYIYICIHNCTYINPFPLGRKKADLVQKRKCDIPMQPHQPKRW